MVLVTSSRSASTALPSEQNQPGRRLAHDAQPTGDGRADALLPPLRAAVIPYSAIFLPCIQSAYLHARWM